MFLVREAILLSNRIKVAWSFLSCLFRGRALAVGEPISTSSYIKPHSVPVFYSSLLFYALYMIFSPSSPSLFTRIVHAVLPSRHQLLQVVSRLSPPRSVVEQILGQHALFFSSPRKPGLRRRADLRPRLVRTRFVAWVSTLAQNFANFIGLVGLKAGTFPCVRSSNCRVFKGEVVEANSRLH